MLYAMSGPGIYSYCSMSYDVIAWLAVQILGINCTHELVISLIPKLHCYSHAITYTNRKTTKHFNHENFQSPYGIYLPLVMCSFLLWGMKTSIPHTFIWFCRTDCTVLWLGFLCSKGEVANISIPWDIIVGVRLVQCLKYLYNCLTMYNILNMALKSKLLYILILIYWVKHVLVTRVDTYSLNFTKNGEPPPPP